MRRQVSNWSKILQKLNQKLLYQKGRCRKECGRWAEREEKKRREKVEDVKRKK